MTVGSVVVRILEPSGARVIPRAFMLLNHPGKRLPIFPYSEEASMENLIASRPTRATSRSRGGAVKFFAGGLVILAVIAYVTFTSFQSNAVYYYTLQEFNTQQAKLAGQNIRINGPLDKSSIQVDQKNLVLKFNLKDGSVVLPVVYHGVAPDTLTSGESVVAEGHLDGGVFQASDILVKCPSKYEPQKTN
jgi:cytochrome c-type biogenesis protein CcmE